MCVNMRMQAQSLQVIPTFFLFTERYSFLELRNCLRFVCCQLSTFHFLVGVVPVLGLHSQPVSSTVDEEPVEEPGLPSPGLEDDAPVSEGNEEAALDVEGSAPVAVPPGPRKSNKGSLA